MSTQGDGKATNNSKEEKVELSELMAYENLNQKIIDSSAWKNIESTYKYLQDFGSHLALQMQDTINKNLLSFSKPFEVQLPEMQKLADNINAAFTVPIKIDYNGFLEPLRKWEAQLAEIIKNIKIPSISEERKQELLETHTLWGTYGWTINPCVEFKTLFNSAPSDKQTADSVALKVCSEKEMEELFDIIMRTKRVKKTDFEEAVFDYKHKKYKSCALVLFSLVDAMLIRLQKNQIQMERDVKLALVL